MDFKQYKGVEFKLMSLKEVEKNPQKYDLLFPMLLKYKRGNK